MSLNATGAISQEFKDNKTNTTITSYQTITNNQFIIPRIADLFTIHSFIFELNPSNISLLEINIGGQTIWSIDFDLLMNLCQYNQKYKTLYVPKDFLLKELIPIMALPLHNITINLKSANTINYTIRLIEQFVTRRKLELASLSYKIIQYPCIPLSNRTNLDSMKSVKGFYIIGPKINSVKLLINNLVLFDYTHREIKEFGSCKKSFSYDTKSLYRHGLLEILPVEMVKHIESFIKKEYIYYIPIGIYNEEHLEIPRIDSVILQFNTNYEGKVIGLDRNILKIGNGMGYIAFA